MINRDSNLNHSTRYTIMKHALLLFLLCLTIPAWSQITKDSVTGTWVCVDNQGYEQKLVISNDSVTVIAQYPSDEDSNEWITITYTGVYTIEKGEKIHVIFNDNPREESFYKVVRAADGTLQIVVPTFEKKKKVDLIYKRR